MSLTFTNCIVRLVSSCVILVNLTHDLIDILSSRGSFPDLKCFPCHFSGIVSPTAAQKENYLEPNLLVKTNRGVYVECMMFTIVAF